MKRQVRNQISPETDWTQRNMSNDSANISTISKRYYRQRNITRRRNMAYETRINIEK